MPNDEFTALCKMKYSDQSIFFLNGFWEDGMDKEVDTIWKTCHKFIELDEQRKAEGNELDEFQAHRLLEAFDTTLTVVAMREALRKIDQDNNGKMAPLEYFVWRYKKGIQDTVDSPQGENKEAIDSAKRKMEEVETSMADVQNKIELQKQAQIANDQKVKEADEAIADVKRQEELVAKAEAELQAAVDDLKKQEEEYQNKIKTLEQKSTDPAASTVAKSKASNELAQLKAEDPLPLRKAKITQEAALRKVQKERKIAEEKVKAAEKVKEELLEMKKQLEQAVKDLEVAYSELEQKLNEAREELEYAKKKGGVAKGALWWMERSMFEADRRLPKAKQKYDHSKPFSFVPQV